MTVRAASRGAFNQGRDVGVWHTPESYHLIILESVDKAPQMRAFGVGTLRALSASSRQFRRPRRANLRELAWRSHLRFDRSYELMYCVHMVATLHSDMCSPDLECSMNMITFCPCRLLVLSRPGFECFRWWQWPGLYVELSETAQEDDD